MPPARRTDAGALPPAAIALMLLLSAVWGLNMVAVKVTSAGIPPVLQAGLRSTLAALIVPLLCRPLGLRFGDWRRGGTLGAGVLADALFAVEFIALYVGISLTTASRAVIFLYGAPFWVALGTYYLVPGDRLARAKATGLCIAFGGLVLAFADGLRAPAGPDALLGDLLCLVGGALWAATTVLVKDPPCAGRPRRWCCSTSSSSRRRCCCSPPRCWARPG
jgi:drug/metabolite transporter (DMT)-like permease